MKSTSSGSVVIVMYCKRRKRRFTMTPPTFERGRHPPRRDLEDDKTRCNDAVGTRRKERKQEAMYCNGPCVDPDTLCALARDSDRLFLEEEKYSTIVTEDDDDDDTEDDDDDGGRCWR